MTKARGAADSIGKAGRGASFLLPAFSPYYVSYFPLFLRARALTYTHLTRMHIHIRGRNTYTRVLFPFCPPLVSVDHLSYLPSPSTTRRSPSASPHRSAPPSFSLRRYCTYVCVRAPCLNRRTRGFMSHGSTLPRREGGFVRG